MRHILIKSNSGPGKPVPYRCVHKLSILKWPLVSRISFLAYLKVQAERPGEFFSDESASNLVHITPMMANSRAPRSMHECSETLTGQELSAKS
mmetsp:Transcript_64795/g.163153  ORF Transcript_64795/g.163153 Transcript_64795/m.163153 type:complete len:93 (-) Transcript_64795:1519-1797(-)